MNIAAYVRVSTSKQVRDGNGMDEQRHAVKEFCDAQRLCVVAWYEDPGISGSDVEIRDGMMALLTAAKTKERPFEAVVTTKIDRLARSLYGQLWVEKELSAAGISLLYAQQENLAGSDPMTTAFRQMMAVFAELEKNLIKARLAGGRLAKARNGGYAGGPPPFGYIAVKGSGVLVVNEEQAAVVRRIFALRAQRWTTRRIADALAAGDVPSASGGTWTHRQVARILARKEFYRGGYNYSGVATRWGQHTATL